MLLALLSEILQVFPIVICLSVLLPAFFAMQNVYICSWLIFSLYDFWLLEHIWKAFFTFKVIQIFTHVFFKFFFFFMVSFFSPVSLRSEVGLELYFFQMAGQLFQNHLLSYSTYLYWLPFIDYLSCARHLINPLHT